MKTALLTIGTEILFGQVVNTNAAWLSKELQNLGIDVMYHYTVGDNPGRLRELLDIAYRDCDMVITTGGLGPTQDDLTKEVICEYFGDVLIEHEEVTSWLKGEFKGKIKWTENNRRQAYFPSEAFIFDNPVGTAPGFRIEKNGKIIMAFPGPPRELKPMFENYAKPYLQKKSDGHLYYRILRFYGIGESALETALMPLIDKQSDPTLATYAKEGECSVRVTSKRGTIEEAKDAVTQMIERIKELAGEYLYSENDEELVDVTGKALIEKQITISCCESCTAGMFASTLCGVPGISSVFDSGLVTYSWNAKQRELGVKKETLDKYTAESPEVAKEMVCGLAAKTGSDFCISITGAAGPDDIDEKRPAGLAYIGLWYKGDVRVTEARYRNLGREHNRRVFVLRMLSEVYHLIK